MTQQTKIFRVFVSSTFTDMKEERSILQNRVFPELERLCESKGAKFQAVDLRWGVTEESQLNQKTLQICLNEIERCQSISPKPNFLILLGDKYGWQSVPEKIPEHEWNLMLPHIIQENLNVLNTWYKKDENAIPAEYLLQARHGDYIDYNKWKTVEKKLQVILRDAVKNTSFCKEQKAKYFNSATHQEILKGALHPELKNVDSHVMAFLRNTANLPLNKEAEGFIDLENGQQDVYAKNQLDTLKTELKNTLKENCVNYNANWRMNKTEIGDANAFFSSVYESFKLIIDEQLSEAKDYDDLTYERNLHKSFMIELVKNFVGRTEILREIDVYADKDNLSDNRPLSIIGPSGSGKSSLMAKSIHNYWTNNKEYGHYVVCYRFMGTSAASSGALIMLQGICTEIARTFGKDILEFVENKQELEELTSLSAVFQKVLSLACLGRPIIVFFDALDQLSDNPESIVSFIPETLPPYVKMVCSALPSFKNHLSFSQIKRLPTLPSNEAKTILNSWLRDINRQLTISQFNYVIERFESTSLPIYLKMAFENVKHWSSYQSNFYLESTVEGIINDFFNRLEKEFPETYVETTVSYLLAGRYMGLTETELLEILAHDVFFWAVFMSQSHEEHRQELLKIKKLPISVWSRLYNELKPFLSERDANGIPIICFFHRQFNEVLRKKYSLISQTKGITKATKYHHNLSTYYNKQNHFSGEKKFEPNIRKCTEIIFQTVQSGNHSLLKLLLSDIIFLQAKSISGLYNEIENDYNTGLKFVDDKTLSTIASAYERHYGWIKDNPHQLFQLLMNDLRWFENTKDISVKAMETFLQRGGQFLLQNFQPEITEGYNYTTLGEGRFIDASPNKKLILIFLKKLNKIQLLNIEKNQTLIDISDVKEVGIQQPFSKNGKFIALQYKKASDGKNAFTTWNIEEQREIFTCYDEYYKSNFANESGLLFLQSGDNNKISIRESAIWNLQNGSEKLIHSEEGYNCDMVYFSPDERIIASSNSTVDGKKHKIQIENNISHKLLQTIEIEKRIKSISWYNNDILMIKTDPDLFLYIVSKNETRTYLKCVSCDISPDNKKIACSISKNINIYDFQSNELLGSFFNGIYTHRLLFTKDSTKLISICNYLLVIWNMDHLNEEEDQMALLYNNEEIISDFRFKDNEQKIETLSVKYSRIWDITKRGIYKDPGHELLKEERMTGSPLANNKCIHSKNGIIVVEDQNRKVQILSFTTWANDIILYKTTAGKDQLILTHPKKKSIIGIWDPHSYEYKEIDLKYSDREEQNRHFEVSPNGKYLARLLSGSKGTFLQIVLIEGGKTISYINISNHHVEMLPNPLRFSDNSEVITTHLFRTPVKTIDILQNKEIDLSHLSNSVQENIEILSINKDNQKIVFKTTEQNKVFSGGARFTMRKDALIIHDFLSKERYNPEEGAMLSRYSSAVFHPTQNILAYHCIQLKKSIDDKDKLNYIQIINSQTGEKLQVLENALGTPSVFKFSETKNLLLLAVSGSINVWDTQSGEKLVEYNKHKSEIASCTFIHNGSKIQSVDKLNTTRIWDSTTGEDLFVFDSSKGNFIFHDSRREGAKPVVLPYNYKCSLKKCIVLDDLTRIFMLGSNNELFLLEPKGL